MAGLKWTNVSKDNPGYSVYHASPTRDSNVLYVIRYKRKTEGFDPIGWRVFVRPQQGVALSTIFVADSFAEAKEFVDEWDKVAEQQ
ncbi:hypothetical protein PBI_MRMAGOO_10 [Mycobacterium phage MrMagoo]|uniref:Uncharacterized protein n=1 Tax=Mycobacterium phage MrMagoo TaxID=1927020 RepID=A0A1L6BYF4_9CAUD|nr:hypothetical protein J4U04_gp010 [Mycobacterium phage MrMagoo]APQ42115.1 hypothetical protein PBI_MRMAGOO_10 [Mycobacterium phage MrMagoo]ARM70191.1 hypothetical protein SEA_GARDENSALSA_10 [Mycobacterium phage GardenSalsa]